MKRYKLLSNNWIIVWECLFQILYLLVLIGAPRSHLRSVPRQIPTCCFVFLPKPSVEYCIPFQRLRFGRLQLPHLGHRLYLLFPSMPFLLLPGEIARQYSWTVLNTRLDSYLLLTKVQYSKCINHQEIKKTNLSYSSLNTWDILTKLERLVVQMRKQWIVLHKKCGVHHVHSRNFSIYWRYSFKN